MKVSSIVATFVTLAAATSALPADEHLAARSSKTLGQAAETCSGNQVVSCCNPTNKQSSAGLLSAIVGPILGNGCTGVGVTVLGILSGNGAGAVCGNTNTVKCCNGNKQTGLINADLSCTDILNS